MNKDDIFNMYNDIDDMIGSIDIKSDDIQQEEVIVVEESIDNDDNIELIDIELEDNEQKENDNAVEYDSDKKLSEIDEMFEEPKLKKRNKGILGIIVFAILDLIAIVCLFLMYGPISYFRNLWVTSAMTTATHQYLAYIFFNEDTVESIMANNTVIESTDSTNTEEIDFNTKEPVVYESIYEEQILKKDEGNDIYKVIDIEGDGYKGHMIVVYDPSRVTLFQAPNINYGGKQMDKMIEAADAYAGINASGFSVINGGLVPAGSVIMDGEIIYDNGGTGWGGGIVGFTYDNVLMLTKASPQDAVKMGVRDAVSFGPFLVVNGVASEFKGNGGYGIAPRTAIGQRKDGIVLLLVIDGRRPGHSLGVDMVELTNIMLKYGAYNASNLDGGGSSSMAVEGKIINVAGGSGYSGNRYLPNAWIVK